MKSLMNEEDKEVKERNESEKGGTSERMNRRQLRWNEGKVDCRDRRKITMKTGSGYRTIEIESRELTTELREIEGYRDSEI